MLTTDQLHIDVQDQGTTRLVALRGEVDVSTAPAVRAALRVAVDEARETVVLDLSGVTFLDSTGLHAVTGACALAEERDRRFVVLPGPPDVQAVFTLAGLDDAVPFARTTGRCAR